MAPLFVVLYHSNITYKSTFSCTLLFLKEKVVSQPLERTVLMASAACSGGEHAAGGNNLAVHDQRRRGT